MAAGSRQPGPIPLDPTIQAHIEARARELFEEYRDRATAPPAHQGPVGRSRPAPEVAGAWAPPRRDNYAPQGGQAAPYAPIPDPDYGPRAFPDAPVERAPAGQVPASRYHGNIDDRPATVFATPEEFGQARQRVRAEREAIPEGARWGGRVEGGADIAPQFTGAARPDFRERNAPWSPADARQERPSWDPPVARAGGPERRGFKESERLRLGDDFSGILPTDEVRAYTDRQNARNAQLVDYRPWAREPEGGYRAKHPVKPTRALDWEELGAMPGGFRAKEVVRVADELEAEIKRLGIGKQMDELRRLEVWGPPDEAGQFSLIGGEKKRLQDRLAGLEKGTPEYKATYGELVRVNKRIDEVKYSTPKASRDRYKQIQRDLDGLDYWRRQERPDRFAMEEPEVWEQLRDLDDQRLGGIEGHPLGELVDNPLDDPVGKGLHTRVRSAQVEIADEVRRGADDPERWADWSPEERRQVAREKAREDQLAFNLGERGDGERLFSRQIADRANEALKTVAKNPNQAMSAFAPLSAANLTLDDDDSEAERALKLAAGVLGIGGALYALGNRGGMARRWMAKAGKEELPGLTRFDKGRLTRDTQRGVASNTARSYVYSHIARGFDPANPVEMVRVTRDLIARGGKGASERQVLLDGQMGNLWARVGPQVDKRLGEVFNQSMNDPSRFALKLGEVIDEELAASGLRTNAAAKLPFEVTQRAKKPLAEALLGHAPGWLVQNVTDGILQKGLSRTFGRLGKEYRSGAAGEILTALRNNGDGWLLDDYLSDGVMDWRNPAEPGIFGKDPLARTVLKTANEKELQYRQEIFAEHGANYLTTAMARELGTVRKKKFALENLLGGDMLGGVGEADRLAFLPERVREKLDGVVTRDKFEQILVGNGIAGRDRDLALSVFDSHQADANYYGYTEARSQMRDYGYRTNLDLMLGAAFPFHYWTTHNLAFVAKFGARHPLPALGLAAAAIATMEANKDLPAYQKMSARVPARALAGLLPEEYRGQVLSGLDEMFGKDQDPRLNLWDFANPAISDIARTIDRKDWQALLEALNPENMAVFMKLAQSMGLRQGPWFDLAGAVTRQAGALPSWLDSLTAEPFQGYGWLGYFGSLVNDGLQMTPFGVVPQAINRVIADRPHSELDERALKEAADRNGYWARKALQDWMGFVGYNPAGTSDPLASANGSRYDPATGDLTPPAKNQVQRAFFERNGDPPPQGTPEADAYWARYRWQVEGQDPEGPGRGSPPSTAKQVAQRGFFDREEAGRPAPIDWDRYRWQVEGQDMPTTGSGWGANPLGDQAVKGARQRLQARLNSGDPAAFEELAGVYDQHGVFRDWETGRERNRGKEYAFGGLHAGASAAGRNVNQNVNDQMSAIMGEYERLKDPQTGKGTAASNAYYNTPLGPGSPSPAEFVNRWSRNGPTGGTGVIGGAPSPSSSSTSSPTGTSGSISGAPRSGRSNSVAASSGRTPATGGSAARSSSTRTGGASPTSRTSSASTSRSWSTSGWDTPGRESPSGTRRVASGSTRTEAPYEPGLTAKEVATRYNDWEAREKEGKADLREAAELVLRHERSGGNPAPYLRRIKYSVYEAIRAYRGETRQGGDKQRGEWFAEVKKLPDETKSLSRLVAIYDAARGKGEPVGRASSQPTATAAPAR